MKIRSIMAAGLALVAVSLAFAADAPEMVPLKLDLPKPAYEGTPKGEAMDPKLMETPRKGPRPDPMVPKGTENLALKKKVTASDDPPIIGKPELITDGNKDCKAWDTWVEYGMGTTWVQIDLEKSQELYAIVIWHYHKDPRVYKSVVVQISDDKDFTKGVTTLFNNDQANDAGLGVGTDKGYVESNEGKLIDAKGAKARYIRLYSKGNTVDDNNQYTEVEAWGLPSK